MTTQHIVIVDYGMANLRSVQKAFEAVGHAAVISADPKVISRATKIVLPGVGAFEDAMTELRGSQLTEIISQHIRDGKTFLGICLGMQMLFTRSHEEGIFDGLNLVAGDVVRFPVIPRLKVPHMGWNTLQLTRSDCPLFKGLPPEPAVYFVHGYYCEPTDANLIAATTDYPTPFCSVLWRDNIFATQFHPEKSQDVGLQMLRNFAAI